jgi:hypothetical protein
MPNRAMFPQRTLETYRAQTKTTRKTSGKGPSIIRDLPYDQLKLGHSLLQALVTRASLATYGAASLDKMTAQGTILSRSPVQILTEYFRGTEISPEFTLRISVRPARVVKQAYFEIQLADKRRKSSSKDPIFTGLFSTGRGSQSIQGWVDGDYFDSARFSDGTRLSLSEASLDTEFFKLLGGLVPSGGSLMVSYSLFRNESNIHSDTRLGLDRGYPPAVTPLGFLLFEAGCGMGFKDWYFAEGGREGPEKLQGFKPIDSETAKQKANLMLHELRAFANHLHDDDLARACRSRADRVIRELEQIRRVC